MGTKYSKGRRILSKGEELDDPEVRGKTLRETGGYLRLAIPGQHRRYILKGRKGMIDRTAHTPEYPVSHNLRGKGHCLHTNT